MFCSLADCLKGGTKDVLSSCEEVGEVYRAGGTVGRCNKGGILYGWGGWVECEVVFVTGEPVGLCVDGVSDDSIGVCCELGFKEGEWWGNSELKEIWEALGRGEGENGKN